MEVPGEFQGRVIVGPNTGPAPGYVFAARDRMDETFDRIRRVRGGRFPWCRTPPGAAVRPDDRLRRGDADLARSPAPRRGQADPIQDAFFAATKPAEELYDTEADPDEVHNLAGDPVPRDPRGYRAALDRWIETTGDLGAVPERELIRRGLVADRTAR